MYEQISTSECRTSDDWTKKLTTRGTSACTSEKTLVREEAAAVALPVKHMTAEVRRVTLKCSIVSLQSRGSKKWKCREHECKLCSAGTFNHASAGSRGIDDRRGLSQSISWRQGFASHTTGLLSSVQAIYDGHIHLDRWPVEVGKR